MRVELQRLDRRFGGGVLTGAGLLAEAAVDALGHVDVVACGLAAAVLALVRLNSDGLERRTQRPG